MKFISAVAGIGVIVILYTASGVATAKRIARCCKDRRREQVRRDNWATVGIYFCYYGIGVFGTYKVATESLVPAFWLVAVPLFLFGTFLRMAGLKSLGDLYCGSAVIFADHHLVTSGIYRHIRHPLHTGILLQVFGIACLTASSLVVWVLAGMLIYLLARRGGIEDALLCEKFGNEAVRYQLSVPAFGLWVVRKTASLD